MKKILFPIFALLALALALPQCSEPPAAPTKSASAVSPHPLTEKEKIEKLIQIVADMKGAQFIRKGTPYDAKAAAQFMQGKWTWKSSEIKTARDFIRICSAGGSGEGTPYYIKLPNGTQLTSKDFLTNQLTKLESQTATAQ
jgi:hypothetical protein